MDTEKHYIRIDEHYRKHRDLLVKKLSGYSEGPHDGQDVVNEAYLRAMVYWHEGIDDFDKWFGGVMFNVLRDFKKDSRRP